MDSGYFQPPNSTASTRLISVTGKQICIMHAIIRDTIYLKCVNKSFPPNVEGLLTFTGIRRGELMGRYSLDWKSPFCSSTVLHFGAKCVNGSLGSLAQYLRSRKEKERRRLLAAFSLG